MPQACLPECTRFLLLCLAGVRPRAGLYRPRQTRRGQPMRA
eukprot:CAMPEP_0179324224 /NCGR_PEP_ID=MMETSP0797-20121207/60163_1 /TAXON_ID=47934 /ORGANISM="Dinophysis acuminata, Strain DAEP01" /LENGTH=40 /DNA_ID= /DNA_START= /DNA_END= /DNA_ORIENTATION=